MSKQINSNADIQDQQTEDQIENDQITAIPHPKIDNYIDNKKNLYNVILEFLESSEDNDDANSSYENFQSLIKIVNNQQILLDHEETQQFLQIIENISDNHHRDIHFIQNVTQIILHYKDQIKQTLSNSEIYRIFENNKILLLFLLKNEIITISEDIYKEMIYKIELNGFRFCYFFYPELEKFKGEAEMKSVKNELLLIDPNIFEDYETKRQIGENDSKICSLIRQDSIEEFITYINRQNYSPSSIIKPSIFETNSFLIENQNVSLIEYAAFFGSIQIFQYLLMSNAKLNPLLWNYSIHSKNSQLIHLLESNNISPPIFTNESDDDEDDENIHQKSDSNDFTKCFIESIKCHHNDIANYIKDNLLLLKNDENDSEQRESIILNYIKHHNFNEFHSDNINGDEFFYLCFYNYNKLVNLLLEKDEIEYKIDKIFDKIIILMIFKMNSFFFK